MKTDELMNYHLEQMDVVKKNQASLHNQGFVNGYKDVYPDVFSRIDKKSVAYIRGNVSLKLMVILYDRVIVYIPPLGKKQLETRFYLNDWSELIALCKQGFVIPIIGKATNYTASHFDELFKLPTKPYSLWARGLSLLDIFGMNNTLEIAKEVLPVDAIANDEVVFKRWAKRYNNRNEEFVKAKIRDDVAVQYADLCIFGCKNEAESLKDLPVRELYDQLQLLNEVRTYPILFGLESQANVDYNKLASLSKIPLKAQNYIPLALPKNELEILYQGIDIDIDNVSVHDIIQYHNAGLGKDLRAALSSFNNYCDERIGNAEQIDLKEVYARAEALQQEVKAAVDELNDNYYYRNLDKSVSAITKCLQVGSITIGAALACLPNASQTFSVASFAAGAGVAIIQDMPEALAEVLVKFGSQYTHNKFVSNMWTAKRKIGGN